jgi:hypothetical protein
LGMEVEGGATGGQGLRWGWGWGGAAPSVVGCRVYVGKYRKKNKKRESDRRPPQNCIDPWMHA